MVICDTEQVSPEVLKITSDTGLAFFIRTEYLRIVRPEQIENGVEFVDDAEEDIVDAGMVFSVECKATEYLSRAEQCRFNLTQKLLKKKYERKYIEHALDYLEEKNYLNDRRFSVSWLNSRKINHAEGRTKLLAELLSRGISKEDSNGALDEFFAENSEEALCKKAYSRFIRRGKTGDALLRAMLGAGFPYALVRQTVHTAESSVSVDFSESDREMPDIEDAPVP